MSRFGILELRNWLDNMEERNAIEPISSLTAWLDPVYPSILEDYVHTLDGFKITHEERLMLESMIHDDGNSHIAPAPKTTTRPTNKRVRWNDHVSTIDTDVADCHAPGQKSKGDVQCLDQPTPVDSPSPGAVRYHHHGRQQSHKQRRNNIKVRSQRKAHVHLDCEHNTETSDARQLFMLEPTSPSSASTSSSGSTPPALNDAHLLSPELESCIMIPWNEDDFSD
ncbi:hypothetical protein AC578_7312 [Pseudocercospora eumusae]|uniref:Uncharacterized protein n=1 Tax=Pseudocercospora eumusae TaxID=321146 RepID=A0A139HWU8_9PEZI|nr:hypothetical protein AC578_7312 [Pseudocercospora eumusae]